jgi:predicted nuclease with TOPRIM domain
MENERNNEQARTKRNGSGVIIFLAILAVLMAIAGALLLREVLDARYQRQMADQRVVQVSEERDNMYRQLDAVEEKYIQLSNEYNQLDSVFRTERNTINQLRAQLRNGGGGDVAGLRRRIAELEAQVEEYRMQIEALQAEAFELSNENSQMKHTLAQTTARNSELENEKKDLESRLEKASYLNISNLETSALRARKRGDEPTDRARRTDKLRTCFTVNQNLVAARGNTDFYIRIVDPANKVLSTSPANTIQYEGEAIQYSLKRTINYQNTSQDVCVMWDQQEDFSKGYYNVVVFWEGLELGYKLFQLQ